VHRPWKKSFTNPLSQSDGGVPDIHAFQ
jgi:hypothetical protein